MKATIMYAAEGRRSGKTYQEVANRKCLHIEINRKNKDNLAQSRSHDTDTRYSKGALDLQYRTVSGK